MTENEIKEMLKTDPERVGKKLFHTQQRMSLLLEMVNELNAEMMLLKAKESNLEHSELERFIKSRW